MSIRDEIDALPEKPKAPRFSRDNDDWAYYEARLIPALEARLAMAERLLREMVTMCGWCEKPGFEINTDPRINETFIPCRNCSDARLYFAKREAEG